jgi:hypothetical protein
MRQNRFTIDELFGPQNDTLNYKTREEEFNERYILKDDYDTMLELRKEANEQFE